MPCMRAHTRTHTHTFVTFHSIVLDTCICHDFICETFRIILFQWRELRDSLLQEENVQCTYTPSHFMNANRTNGWVNDLFRQLSDFPFGRTRPYVCVWPFQFAITMSRGAYSRPLVIRSHLRLSEWGKVFFFFFWSINKSMSYTCTTALHFHFQQFQCTRHKGCDPFSKDLFRDSSSGAYATPCLGPDIHRECSTLYSPRGQIWSNTLSANWSTHTAQCSGYVRQLISCVITTLTPL